jgi:hypothetical protein
VLVELGVMEQHYNAVKEARRKRHRDGGRRAQRRGPSSVHNWLRRYRERGMAGLVDRSKRPRTCPLRTPARAEIRVIELRRDHHGGDRGALPDSIPCGPHTTNESRDSA